MAPRSRKADPEALALGLAKLTRPSATGVYARTRLFKILDQGRQSPVVWISAPAGAGKTTLVSSYLRARRLASIWYEMDAGDNDVASFFYHMGLAARQANPSRKTPLPLFTPEYIGGLPAFTLNYFRALFETLRRPSVLVFDNYQDVQAEGNIQEALQHGLEQAPRGVTTIVISREEPPGAFARWRASGRMLRLGWDDLRLTASENAQIVRLRCGKLNMAADSVERLHQSTQGWVAGLVLLTEHRHKASGEPLRAIDTGTNNQSIFDYFANEVFRHSEPAIQTFLLTTAFLPNILPSIARQITQQEASETILSDLARRNYFTVKHADGSYEYHPLFRAFLMSRAEALYDARRLKDLKRHSAELLAKHGDVDSAVRLLQQSEDWDKALQLTLDHAPTLYAQGRMQTLEAWLDAFPDSVCRSNAWVVYWRGFCQLPFSPEQARRYLEQAFVAFESGSDSWPLYLTWVRIVDSYLIELDDFTPLIAWLDRYPSLEVGRSPPPRKIEEASAFTYLNCLMYARFDHPDLDIYARRAEELFDGRVDGSLRLARATSLIAYHLWKGNVKKITSLMNSVAGAVKQDTRPLAQLSWYLWKSLYAADVGAADESRQAVVEGLAQADACGIHTLDLQLLAYGIWGQLCVGNIATARAFLERMAPLTHHGRIRRAFYYHYSSMVSLHEGNVSRAIEEGRQATEMAHKYGLSIATGSHPLALTYAYTEAGDTDAAWALLTELRPKIAAMRSKFFASYLAFSEANVHRIRGETVRALSALKEALALAAEGGFVTPGYCPRDAVAALYALALDARIEVDYVQETIRKTNLPPPSGMTSQQWPWRLRLYTLGRFVLLKDDKPLSLGAKAQKKPLDLLRALAAHGGRGVAQTKLAQALWPETDGDMAAHALETTLYRLRKLLGEQCISNHDGQLSLNPHVCWFDVWAVERVLEEPAESAATAQLLLNLYHGAFLEGDDAPWMLVARERIRSKFIRGIARLGEVLETTEDRETAIACYRKGIETDPLAEEFYHRLMLIYYQQGRRAEALALYRRLRATLSAVLQIEPKVETTELYRRIQDAA